MAEKLTPQQELAVKNRGGKLLVSAAAGSGKTKVLVDRLMSYLKDPVDPANLDDFLIITYTKAAAAELRGKIGAKLTEHIAADPTNRHLQQQMQRLYLAKISTVHSFCSDILKEFSYKLDISSDFRLADESEAAELQMLAAERVLEQAYTEGDEDFFAFVDTQGLGRTDYQIPVIIFDVYERSRCHLDPEKWLSDCLTSSCVEDLSDAGETVWGRYLMDDLFSYLDMHLSALRECATRADAALHMEKPAALLWDTVTQLQRLRDSETWDEIICNKNIAYGTMRFDKKCEDVLLIDQIKAVRNACKDGLEKKLKTFADNSEKVLVDIGKTAGAMRGLVAMVRRFSQEYQSMKRSRRIVDFSDLEHMALDLLVGKSRTAPTSLAKEIGERYREVMVDEYQDSNAVQDRIFSALTEKKQNCFMVGDVKQSIYQFRLADPEIFLEKYKTYASAENADVGQGRKVLLSSNFRSSGGVISAVNDVFSACMSDDVGGLEYGPDEMLNEGIPHIDIGEPEVELYALDVVSDTYGEEAAFTADRIVKLLDGKHMVREKDILRPIRAEDIVILLRSPGSVGWQFQQALEQRGVRCVSSSTNDIMQSEEIVVLRAILQTIDNPLQDISLIAMLTSRVFGFGANDIAKIRVNKRHCSVFSALKKSDDERVKSFLDLLSRLRSAAQNRSLTQLLNMVIVETKLDSIYGAMKLGENRVENIHRFCQLAASFESNGRGYLGRFLDYLNALDESGYGVEEENTADAVRIMSIHKSKGLEFPVVFLCGLSKGFNKEDTKAPVLCDRELGLGLCCADFVSRVKYPTVARRSIGEKKIRDMISEELRVLYVAMTRARDRLIMTYAKERPEKKIWDLAYRMDVTPRKLLTSDVSCAGDWVLLSALLRPEATDFYRNAVRPESDQAVGMPWLIRLSQAGNAEYKTVVVEEETAEKISPSLVDKIGCYLNFSYPYKTATQTPSKQTATQLKGREKDKEAAENTHQTQHHSFRKPSFIAQCQDTTGYGNLIHGVMERIDFGCCTDEATIKEEIRRLVQDGYLDPKQEQMVDTAGILRFLNSEIGAKIKNSKNNLREFKFSILDDADRYGEGLSQENVLLQGVVDLALIDDDGITIIDFKTDHVTNETLDSVADRYRQQVRTYAYAMERIFEKPVKNALLYFFRLGEFYPV